MASWNDGGDSPYGYGPQGSPHYGDPEPAPEPQSSLVRMYSLTGGRTAPRTDLAIEALVSSATSIQLGTTYTREYRAISELCGQIRSVAEVSALLGMPLGVARVLIADMAYEGLLRIYQPQLDAGAPNQNLLERVLIGLRRL
ncbi:DUF742 domain-containing protein [Sphaerisporangium perillae]|uniref:DUF742 domain-containing protein n=1 Tax=Sphaerisporangium perillae TaxID=2935860 RepID=UPI0027DF66F2|nr:DUF742 domain-containing protein [Sphaerisporangium perillae]